MTKNHYHRVKTSLQAINKLELQRDDKQTVTLKNGVRVEYEHKIIDLGDYQIIVSGSAEQLYEMHHSKEKIVLWFSVYDNEANELPQNKPQHTTLKRILTEKLSA